MPVPVDCQSKAPYFCTYIFGRSQYLWFQSIHKERVRSHLNVKMMTPFRELWIGLLLPSCGMSSKLLSLKFPWEPLLSLQQWGGKTRSRERESEIEKGNVVRDVCCIKIPKLAAWKCCPCLRFVSDISDSIENLWCSCLNSMKQLRND